MEGVGEAGQVYSWHVRSHLMLCGVKVAEVAEQEAQCTADLAVRLGRLLQNAWANLRAGGVGAAGGGQVDGCGHVPFKRTPGVLSSLPRATALWDPIKSYRHSPGQRPFGKRQARRLPQQQLLGKGSASHRQRFGKPRAKVQQATVKGSVSFRQRFSKPPSKVQ
eukprot:364601-Chlamydomonas_euryale.AAC.2